MTLPMILLGILAIGTDLQQALLDELSGDADTDRSGFQIVAIAANDVSSAQLADLENRYRELVDSILSDVKIRPKKPEKTAKQLHEKMFETLIHHDESNLSLYDLVEEKFYSSFTASYLMRDLAAKAGIDVSIGLSPAHAFCVIRGQGDIVVECSRPDGFDVSYDFYKDLGRDLIKYEICTPDDLRYLDVQKTFDSFYSRRGVTDRELASAMVLQVAFRNEFVKPDELTRALFLSHRLAPNSRFGEDYLDRKLYGRMYESYQDLQSDASPGPQRHEQVNLLAELAASAATRFPENRDIPGLLFNTAIMRFQAMDIEKQYASALDYAARIKPLMSAFDDKIDAAISTLHFNYAIDLFNHGDFRKSIEQADLVEIGRDSAEFIHLMTNAYAQRGDQLIDDGDQVGAAEMIAKLETMDKDKAAQLRVKLDHKRLEALHNSGDYATALEIATENLDTRGGVNNYLVVLTRHVEHLIAEQRLADAAEVLERVPDELRSEQAFADLKFNRYVAAINAYPKEDYKQTLPLYEQVLSDPELVISAEERAGFEENHAVSLALEVQSLMQSEAFELAGSKLERALERYPESKHLQALFEQWQSLQQRLK